MMDLDAELPKGISYSQARLWHQCMLAWAYRYAWRVDADAPDSYRFGSAMHEAFATGYETLAAARTTNQYPTHERIEQLALESLGEAWEKHLVDWATNDYDYAQDIVRHEFRPDHLTELVQRGGVIAAEQFLRRDVTCANSDGEKRTVPVTVKIDLVLAYGDGVEIRDHKFGRRRNAEVDKQLHTYAHVWQLEHPDQPVHMLSLSFPNDDALVQAAPNPAAARDTLTWLADTRDEILRAHPDHAWPSNPGPACERCDHRHVCPYAALALDLDAT